jgi:hypothetical protein
MTGVTQMMSSNDSERAELLLRTSRRALLVVLGLVLFVAATLIAHVIRPGSLLADWASRMGWLFPFVVVGVYLLLNLPRQRPFRADDPEVKTMLKDEFRQVNLARAQRIALIVVLVAQMPLAFFLSGLTAAGAVTVMGVATVAIAIATLIISFLYFDRG